MSKFNKTCLMCLAVGLLVSLLIVALPVILPLWRIGVVLLAPVLLGVPNCLFMWVLSRRCPGRRAWWFFALSCLGAVLTLLAVGLLALLEGQAIDGSHEGFLLFFAYVFGYCPMVWVALGFWVATREIKRRSKQPLLA